jgi:hypothetical protein
MSVWVSKIETSFSVAGTVSPSTMRRWGLRHDAPSERDEVLQRLEQPEDHRVVELLWRVLRRERRDDAFRRGHRLAHSRTYSPRNLCLPLSAAFAATRGSATAALLGNYLYVAGGVDGTGAVVLNSVERATVGAGTN